MNTNINNTSSEMQTISCELVVVGAGPAGLTAAIQAAELGLKTVILEATDALGGNGPHTEGVFAIGSRFQKQLGIEIAPRGIIEAECNAFNYHIDALRWKDLIENSADNIDWLIKHGVVFSGVVDDCKGYAPISTFHWFPKREYDGRGDGNLFVGPLAASAKKMGVSIYMNTCGTDLVMENGCVIGIYAKNLHTEEVSKFDCKAVILATGGFADNDKMMTERGFQANRIFRRGFPGHNGDGVRLAASAGGEDVSRLRTYLDKLYIHSISPYSLTNAFINLKGLTLWVNGHGERFVNEACGDALPCFFSNAKRTQEESFAVFDSAFIEAYGAEAAELRVDLDRLIAEGAGNCFCADTFSELAEAAGIPSERFCYTVERYNKMCGQSRDDDFAKTPSKLLPVLKAPFFIVRQDIAIWTSIGGVRTSRKFEVLTPQGKPVPGLYCVGVDGCELYWDCYTLTVPGSANGNSVHSGRTASRAAFEYI